MSEPAIRHHLLQVRVADRPGALERVLGMIRRSLLGVAQLSFGGDHSSALHLVVRIDAARTPIERVRAEFGRLVDVQEIREIGGNGGAPPTRELALVRMHAAPPEPLPAGARLLEDRDGQTLLELTGSPEEIDAALVQLGRQDQLAGYVRSGELAVP